MANRNLGFSGEWLARWTVAVLLLVIVAASMTGTAAAQTAPDCSTVTYNGAGTEANPYEVGNVNQLQCIESRGLNASYEVVSDINASETVSWNNGKGFEPIGEFNDTTRTVIAEFNGTFDGVNYDITDLTIVRPDNVATGLFSTIDSAGTVTNVSVVDADINGSNGVGILAGSNSGTISKSNVSGSVEGSDIVGGLIGENLGGTIKQANVSVSVEADDRVGTLAGKNSGTVNESYATGAVNGSLVVGGLVGENKEGGTISESYATGEVEATAFVGGLLGGNGGTVNESYATGAVNGSLVVGGLVGSNDGTVDESYWDTRSTGQSTSDGGTGLNTSEMTGSAARNNMLGFDFTNTWETVSGDYPILAFQSQGDGGGNPFFDASGNPLSRQMVIDRVVRWNLNGEINGTPFTRNEIINFVVQWNLET